MAQPGDCGGSAEHMCAVCLRSLGLPAAARSLPHLPGPCRAPPHTAGSLSRLPPRPPWAPQRLPVAFPGVPHICVVDAVSVCLLIQEIKHVLDGQGKCAAPVHSAEQGLEQVIHELLQGALGWGWGRRREYEVKGGGGGERQQATDGPARWCLGPILPWKPVCDARPSRQS